LAGEWEEGFSDLQHEGRSLQWPSPCFSWQEHGRKRTQRGMPQPNSYHEEHEEHEEEASIWSFSRLRVLRVFRGEESFQKKAYRGTKSAETENPDIVFALQHLEFEAVRKASVLRTLHATRRCRLRLSLNSTASPERRSRIVIGRSTW
jgi:hypothetical protein